MASYVITSWKINDNPASIDDPCVKIEGRADGLIAWLLNLVHISPTMFLTVTGRDIVYKKASLSGNLTYRTPLAKTSSICHGFSKPWATAILLGVIVAAVLHFIRISYYGDIIADIAGLAVAVVYYFLNLELTLGYTDVAGTSFPISFKPSVIDGKNIDEESVTKVAAKIQSLVEKAER
jgi:hypothetical protein